MSIKKNSVTDFQEENSFEMKRIEAAGRAPRTTGGEFEARRALSPRSDTTGQQGCPSSRPNCFLFEYAKSLLAIGR